MPASTPSAFASGLAEEWRPGFVEAANEERRVTRGFMNGTNGAVKLKNKLYIRKIEAAGGSNVLTLSTSSSALAGSVTFYTSAPTNVFVTPVFYYIGMEFTPHTLSRLQEDGPKARASYRNQMVKALATKVDTVGSAQAPNISRFVGGAGQNLDQPMLAAAVQSLAVSAKDAFQIGTTKPYLTIINTQIASLLQIPGFTQANLRGEPGAVMKGWVWDAYNVQIQESGNVYVASSVAHNLLYLDQCEVLAYNDEPYLWDPVRDGMSWLEFASMEFGVQELFDEYGADIQTAG